MAPKNVPAERIEVIKELCHDGRAKAVFWAGDAPLPYRQVSALHFATHRHSHEKTSIWRPSRGVSDGQTSENLGDSTYAGGGCKPVY